MHTTQATTECYQQNFDFQGLGGRRVVAGFSGGYLSSDGGALLLREMERSQRLCEQLAGCFGDHRDPDFVEHDLAVMLRQRILGLALGYADINDHERLRLDPPLAAVCGRADVLGQERHMTQDKGRPLAGKSTFNRLELGAQEINARTKKIQAHPERIEALLLLRGVDSSPKIVAGAIWPVLCGIRFSAGVWSRNGRFAPYPNCVLLETPSARRNYGVSRKTQFPPAAAAWPFAVIQHLSSRFTH